MHLLFISGSLLAAVYATYALASQTRYVRDNLLDGYNCDTNDIAFTSNARSLIACGRECSITNTCFSWFYDGTNGTCYGCNVDAHAGTNALVLKTGTNYYKHACESGWVAIHGGCYLFATVKTNFTTAWSYCEQRQSQLVYLETESEISMVTEYLLNDTDTEGVIGYWLAITDEAVDGVWRMYGNNDLVTVFNWGQGQPESGNSEHHAFLYKIDSFKWHDVSWNCADFNPICQRN